MKVTGRIQALNGYRKERNLRPVKDSEQAKLFLTEEHAPFLLPSDYVFPWGGKPGHANEGPPARGASVISVASARCGEVGSRTPRRQDEFGPP